MARPNVYDFSSIRQVVEAFLHWMKERNKSHSIRWVAKRAGLKSHTLILGVANGSRIPSKKIASKLAEIFSFTVDERIYFNTLILSQSAETHQERNYYLDRLRELKLANGSVYVEEHEFAGMSEWHYLAILELLELPGFVFDPKWIYKKLGEKISEIEVERALKHLIERDIVKKGADGQLSRGVGTFNTTHNIPSPAIRRFHRQTLELAKNALEDIQPGERLFFGKVMALNRSKLAEASEIIMEFRTRFHHLLQSGDADAVYHLGIQLIPWTRSDSDSQPDL